MARIVLEARAILKRLNAGGVATVTGRGEHKGKIGIGRVKPSYSYVFLCPDCGKRNNQNTKQGKAIDEQRVLFVCNGCCRKVEVSPPDEAPKIILSR